MQTEAPPLTPRQHSIPTAIDLILSALIREFHKPLSTQWLAVFGLLLLCCCVTRAWVGFDGMNAYSHDLFVFLDGGWRVLHGQIPYNDFFTDVGTFIHLETAFGLWLARGQARGLAYAQALFGIAFTIWAYVLARTRFMPRPALLFTWTVVLLAITPSVVGDSLLQLTAACFYNRYGYALCALVLIEAFKEGQSETRFSSYAGGFSSGALTALLLFIKVTFFIGSVGLLVALIPCRKQTRFRCTGLACGFLCVLVPMWLYMRSDLRPMLRNLQFLAGAKHLSILPMTLPHATSATCEMLILGFLACAVLWEGGAWAKARRLITLVGVVLSIAAFFLLTNFQRGRLPLLAVLGLLIAQEIESHFRNTPSLQLVPRTAILALSCLFVAGSITLDAIPLVCGAAFHSLRFKTNRLLFNSPELAGIRDVDAPYVAFVNDGIALLQRNHGSGETVVSLDFSNPFPYSLGIPPPKGGTPVGIQYRTNFDDAHQLPPAWLFGSADLVMLPVTFTDGTLQESVPRIYGPYLRAHFHAVDRSENWLLYRKDAIPKP